MIRRPGPKKNKRHTVDHGGKRVARPVPQKKRVSTVIISKTTPAEDQLFVEQLMAEKKKIFEAVTEVVSVEIKAVSVEEEKVEEKEYFLVIDFEATCFKEQKIPREETEIIEFAAALVDKEGLEIVDEFDSFVKPVLHPQLESFCTELTTITQELVDKGYSFKTVYRLFLDWLARTPGKKLFCSWGDYDKHQLKRDCFLHDLEYPFDESHLNMKQFFSEAKGYKRNYGLGSALRQMKLEFEGIEHRGIDDVKNIVRIMKEFSTELSAHTLEALGHLHQEQPASSEDLRSPDSEQRTDD